MGGDEKKKRSSGQRPKKFGKRKFTGNPQTRSTEGKARKHTEEADVPSPSGLSECAGRAAEPGPSSSSFPCTSTAPDKPVQSAASAKLRSSLDPVVTESRKNWSGFRVIDKDLVFDSFVEVVVCGVCREGKIDIIEKEVTGLFSVYQIHCSNCGTIKVVNSCEKIGNERKAPEANRRAVYAFKSLGLGQHGLADFSALMDFPPAVTERAFDKAVSKIQEASTEVAEASMKKAAEEEIAQSKSSDITVSGDASWMKRGFTSLFGVMILIGLFTGKVVDFMVLSLVCLGCSSYKGAKSGDEFEEWQRQHAPKCSKNHEGSSGSMEVSGCLQLFARSVKERGVRYLKYIGDGDSKTYKVITAAKPYGITQVSKLECTAHVKKRMGTRLRKLVEDYKGKKIGEKKGLGGPGRLTRKFIDRISDYYGMAVQSNNTVDSMYNAIWAIFYHLSSSDQKPTHHLCPQGPDSWCPYQKAVFAGKVDSYKHDTKKTLPLPVMEACRKVFTDLSQKDLLERCVGGYTQNPNESFNALIWQLCPKVKFFGKKTVDFATSEAVIHFNDGNRGKLKVLECLGITPGKHCVAWAIASDEKRVAKADIRAQAATKKARIEKKRQNKSTLDANKDDSYVPGGY